MLYVFTAIFLAFILQHLIMHALAVLVGEHFPIIFRTLLQ